VVEARPELVPQFDATLLQQLLDLVLLQGLVLGGDALVVEELGDGHLVVDAGLVAVLLADDAKLVTHSREGRFLCNIRRIEYCSQD
jgi:hypothetical protein